MNGAKVADIVVGQQDFTGATILTVYSKVSDTYAVYQTSERVMVQYADDPALGAEQRKALAPLNPARGEINGLVDGWRAQKYVDNAAKKARAHRFDRRTADALTVALQGDQAHAAELLAGVKADILEERTSIGRTEYLITAALSAAVLVVLFQWLLSFAADAKKFGDSNNLWAVVSLGALGALFSIGLAIRGRAIHTDLQRRDNIVDALLRISIGAVSAVVLFALLQSNLVSASLGGTPISMTTTYALIVIAFLAGFAERLVGDFLSSVVLGGVGGATAASSAGGTQSAAADGASKKANEQDPLGLRTKDAEAPKGEADAAGDAGEADDDHDHTDGCLCDTPIDAIDEVDDKELPEASGGIEKAAA